MCLISQTRKGRCVGEDFIFISILNTMRVELILHQQAKIGL
jgi:hypothetical protein